MKTAKLAAAIATVVTGMIATNAQAAPSASAESIVAISNFTISQGGVELSTGAFSTLSPTDTESTTATLNGVVNAPADVHAGDGSPLHNQAWVGTIQPATVNAEVTGNTSTTAFSSVYPLPINGNFAASALNQNGAPITGLAGNVGNAHASINNASYAALTTNGAASTATDSTLTSKLVFTAATNGVMTFDFNFGAYLNAYLSNPDALSAKASYHSEFDLVDVATGLSVFDTATGKVGGFSNNSIFDLNGNMLIANQVSDNAPGAGLNIQKGFPFTNLSNNGTLNTVDITFNTLSLVSGHQYQLTATTTTDANVQLKVPEPGILALMGIGLMGLGASRKFRVAA